MLNKIFCGRLLIFVFSGGINNVTNDDAIDFIFGFDDDQVLFIIRFVI